VKLKNGDDKMIKNEAKDMIELDEMNVFKIQAEVTLEPRAIEANIRDQRIETVNMFSDAPDDMQRMSMVEQIWRIGVAALASAQSHATIQRTEEIAERMQKNMISIMDKNIRRQEETLTKTLSEWVDPKSGKFTGRLEDLLGDDGEIATLLKTHLSSDSSTLANTLAKNVGENSLISNLLDPNAADGFINNLSKDIEATLSKHNISVQEALDPLHAGGPANRFMTALKESMKDADSDREVQLQSLTAALDANDENSLLSRLMRETSAARSEMLIAMDPTREDSPMHAIQRTIVSTLQTHSEKVEQEFSTIRKEQQEFLNEIIERMAIRKERKSTTAGGNDFESDLHDFLVKLLPEQMVSIDQVGNETGLIKNCKVGDIVTEFLPEHQLAGSRVVFEAKRDANYKVPKALEEIQTAIDNRGAEVGVFVFESSRAPKSMPPLSRHGNRILVIWDNENPEDDHYLMAAAHIALGIINGQNTENEGEREAISTVVGRLESEINRIGTIDKYAGNIVRDGSKIHHELTIMRKKLDLSIREASRTLEALGIECTDPVDIQFKKGGA
jgi:hypothetical protein